MRRNHSNLSRRRTARMTCRNRRRRHAQSWFMCCSSRRESSGTTNPVDRNCSRSRAMETSNRFGQTASHDAADHTGLVQRRPGTDGLDGLGLTTELHARFYRVKWMADAGFDEASRTTGDEVHQRMLLLGSG